MSEEDDLAYEKVGALMEQSKVLHDEEQRGGKGIGILFGIMMASLYMTIEVSNWYVFVTFASSLFVGGFFHASIVDGAHKETRLKLAESQGKLKALSDLPGVQAEIMATPVVVFGPDYENVEFRYIEDVTYIQVDVDNETVALFERPPKIASTYTTSDVGEC